MLGFGGPKRAYVAVWRERPRPVYVGVWRALMSRSGGSDPDPSMLGFDVPKLAYDAVWHEGPKHAYAAVWRETSLEGARGLC